MKLLVTGANGDIGDAIGRILKESYPDSITDGADCSGLFPASLLFDHVHELPPAKSPEFLSAFERLAVNYDFVIPVPEAELAVLATQSADWRVPLGLVMNEPWVISTFCDKLETARWLERCGDVCVRTTLLSQVAATELPVVVKPRRGWGSKGIQTVHTGPHLSMLKTNASEEWIAQTFLDASDSEYTCAIIKDNEIVNTIIMRRSLQGGLTKQAETVDDEGIQSLLSAIAFNLPVRAFINVQLRVFRGKPQVFEINPRFSSTVMMRHIVGFSDLIWAIDALQGRPMRSFRARTGVTIFRMSREVILDR